MYYFFFYFKNENYKKNSKCLCEKNEEEKKDKSTDIYHTLLNGGARHAETNEPNLKHFAPIDDFITGGVDPLSIFRQLTPSLAQ